MDYATWEPYLHSLYVSPYPPFPYQMTYWKEGQVPGFKHGSEYEKSQRNARSSSRGRRGRGSSRGRGRGSRGRSNERGRGRGRGRESIHRRRSHDCHSSKETQSGPTYKDIVAKPKPKPKIVEQPKPKVVEDKVVEEKTLLEWGDIE